jgi:hypothetical protein
MQTVTVELPRPLFERVQQRAERLHRSLESELVALIADGLSVVPEDGAMPAYDEIVDLIARGAPPQEIANFRLSPDAQVRAHDLLARNLAGTLTASEEAELDLFTQLEHLMGLVKVRARQILASRE